MPMMVRAEEVPTREVIVKTDAYLGIEADQPLIVDRLGVAAAAEVSYLRCGWVKVKANQKEQ